MFNEPVLFIGAHHDDIEINAGGIVSMLTAKNKEVHCMVVDGSSTSRRVETLSSMKILGARNVHFGISGVDTRFYEHLRTITLEIESVIKQYNIKTIVTHFPYDTHQDHATTSQAAVIAGRLCDNIIFFRPTFPSGRTDIPFNPSITVKLSEEDIKAKLDSIGCHKSQIIKYGSEDYLNVIKDVAKAEAWVHGGFHGYAEVFQLSRSLI